MKILLSWYVWMGRHLENKAGESLCMRGCCSHLPCVGTLVIAVMWSKEGEVWRRAQSAFSSISAGLLRSLWQMGSLLCTKQAVVVTADSIH